MDCKIPVLRPHPNPSRASCSCMDTKWLWEWPASLRGCEFFACLLTLNYVCVHNKYNGCVCSFQAAELHLRNATIQYTGNMVHCVLYYQEIRTWFHSFHRLCAAEVSPGFDKEICRAGNNRKLPSRRKEKLIGHSSTRRLSTTSSGQEYPSNKAKTIIKLLRCLPGNRWPDIPRLLMELLFNQ